MVIGIVGGMGSYATVDFFKRIVDSFPAEKEWERPRILIDNHCTMPSRVRALLYHEKREELVRDLIQSIDLLVRGGATDIVLACNTSHCFLADIYEKRPELRKYILNIIELCAEKIREQDVKEVYLIATEGTIETKIYNGYLSGLGVNAILPTQDEQVLIRGYIEAVKQNALTDEVMQDFYRFVDESPCENVVLGCTEIPVIYGKLNKKPQKKIFDPLQFAIDELKAKYQAV